MKIFIFCFEFHISLIGRVHFTVSQHSLVQVMIHCNMWGPKEPKLWVCGIKTETKYPQLHYYWILALRTLHRSFAVGDSNGMATGHILYQIYTNFPLPGTRKKGRPCKTWSECVKTYVHKWLAWLASTCKTEMLGELVFDIAWCCQPHWMGHGEHLNLKWIWMDG